MSDLPDAGSRSELTPEQESEVRRLLVAARHDQPLPPGLADRLDRVLADLSPQDAVPAPAPVGDLSVHRRRRNVAVLLAAAAAVIVAGFGIGQVIDVGDRSGDTAGGSAAEPANREQAEGQTLDDGSAAGGGEAPGQSLAGPVPSLSPLDLSSAHLGRDLAEQLPDPSASSGDLAAQESSPEAFAAYGCAPSAPEGYGPGNLFPALYDGQPAVLALRPQVGGTRQADVLACGSAVQLGSTTLPRP